MAESRDNGKLSASELGEAAMATIDELTGYDPEGGHRASSGTARHWTITVDVLRALARPEHDRRDGCLRRAARRAGHAARLQAHAALPARRGRRGVSVDERPLPGRSTATGSPAGPRRAPTSPTSSSGCWTRASSSPATSRSTCSTSSCSRSSCACSSPRWTGPARWASTGGRATPRCRASTSGENGNGDGGHVQQLERENRELRERLDRLEQRLEERTAWLTRSAAGRPSALRTCSRGPRPRRCRCCATRSCGPQSPSALRAPSLRPRRRSQRRGRAPAPARCGPTACSRADADLPQDLAGVDPGHPVEAVAPAASSPWSAACRWPSSAPSRCARTSTTSPGSSASPALTSPCSTRRCRPRPACRCGCARSTRSGDEPAGHARPRGTSRSPTPSASSPAARSGRSSCSSTPTP